MAIEASTMIKAEKEQVWDAITDMESAVNRISGIKDIQILERPASGIVGLKWKETRMMFNKEAIETMWVTEAKEFEWYETRAENCGCVYNTIVKMEEFSEGIKLSMVFKSTPQTFMAKLMSPLFLLFNGAIKKAFEKDLKDLKVYLERK